MSNDHSQLQTNETLVDKCANFQTVRLFEFLRDSSNKGILFGHQDDLAYGVNWQSESGRSDIKEVCGQYPAVFGWDIGGIGQDQNLDGLNFDDIIAWIQKAHRMGGIITISMHLDNPLTGNDAWDNTLAVDKILPGKSHHKEYLSTLRLVADFLGKLKDKHDQYIPIIFRPYHEHNHTWSWWGKSSCSKYTRTG